MKQVSDSGVLLSSPRRRSERLALRNTIKEQALVAEQCLKRKRHEQASRIPRKRLCKSDDYVIKEEQLHFTDAEQSLNPRTGWQNRTIQYWVDEKHWPEDYISYGGMNQYPLPRKKSTPSLRRKASEATISSHSDQRLETKSTPQLDVRYESLLASKGSFMDQGPGGITSQSKELCRLLLENAQQPPSNTLFEAGRFEKLIRLTRSRNEARIIQDISRLLVPSAENFAICGSNLLDNVIESVNEAWANSIPFVGTRPQPDYSVGFKASAFTKERLAKLEPLVGGIDWISFFRANHQTYFPFLTCEVKCGSVALDVADRQNAHSMTLAVRGVMELFSIVGREKELDRQILGFSISHDHRSVRLYGHYTCLVARQVSFHRHSIRTFDFTEQEGKEKWSSYSFTKNVYELWVPEHLRRICSAIDSLPNDVDFALSIQQSNSSQAEDSALEADDSGSQGRTSIPPSIAHEVPSKKLRTSNKS